MKVERPRPRRLLPRLWWDYQTRHGCPGYRGVPLGVLAVLAINTTLYMLWPAHPPQVVIMLITVMGYGAALAAWWIRTGYHYARTLVATRCGIAGCGYAAYTVHIDLAERAAREHAATVHGAELTDEQIGRIFVDRAPDDEGD